MLKVTTWNVNGLRAREAQLTEWIAREKPDLLCLQEIKASTEQIPRAFLEHPDYVCYWHGQKGYSGVALLVSRALGLAPIFAHPDFDHETRIVTATIGELFLASIYVPNGGKDFEAKMRFLEAMDRFTARLEHEHPHALLCGDLNVAREVRDVYPSLLRKGHDLIGTTPDERALFARMLSHGLVDLHRAKHPDDDHLFTWWAPWRGLREKNVGWRIDYQLASRALATHALTCDVDRTFGTSDHGPLTATFDWTPRAP